MTTCGAVEYSLGLDRPRQAQVTPQNLLGLHDSAARSSGCVYALREEDLTLLATPPLAALLRPMRTKNAAKPLSDYLSRTDGICRVSAPYKSPGQAERSIRTCLETARRRGQHGICLVGVPGAIFEQLWARADKGQPAGAWNEAVLREPDADYLRVVLEQTEDLKVPDGLRETYLGSSPKIEVVRRLIVRASKHEYPVLVEGETGTGKEDVARQIHLCGSRAAERFVPVNCGGIPTELLESELFGHIKGSFTGALRDKKGLWTLADRGTLLLDEIGDLCPRHQVKVLRALETGKYTPVGAESDTHSHARIVAATNRDLNQMVCNGTFREDLYYRIFAMRIRTPALREHPEDIPSLANRFWARICGEQSVPLPAPVTDELTRYPWPGNARELKAFLTNVFALVDAKPVSLSVVRAVFRERNQYATARPRAGAV